MSENLLINVTEIAREARAASARIARFSADQRNNALLAVADRLVKSRADILAANELDCKTAAEAVSANTLSPSLYKRLKLDGNKFDGVIEGIRQVAALPDPLGAVTLARELDDGLELYRVSCPIGVVLVIFEARPDALPQILSLLVKSGNAGILKGGAEAKHTNELMFKTISVALQDAGYPSGAYALVPGRHEVQELLNLDQYVDLVIPRGSNQLVRSIQSSTKIPVLGHAEGICHLYVDAKADLAMATKLAVDAKTNYPAACNSVETILVHRSLITYVEQLVGELRRSKVEVRMTPADASQSHVDATPLAEEDFSTEYSDLIVSLKLVDSIDEAISHINRFGSGHTETIVTSDKSAFEKFFGEVNSSGVYWNASTRFADGFRYGFGAEVGISTTRMHPRGPVGVEGITTYKYKLVGAGHVVADYAGENAKTFKHRDLNAEG